ncbi:MAG TPA: gluconokinase [Chitinophagaceae bacterium]|nr:gluconokinase [Chitinophagaceae bacterium]
MPSRIIYIMGVSGSGKTTIGRKLSTVTGIPFFDGDDYHSAANKKKMESGHPLNDDDRRDWLISLNDLARKQSATEGAIIACSALKEKYRELLEEGIKARVDWILLQGNFQLISQRIHERKGHFMAADLLASQFDTLELPTNAILVDVTQSPEEIVSRLIGQLDLQ